MLTFSDGPEIDVGHLPARVQGQRNEQPLPFNEHLSFKDAKEQLLESFEREYISQVLRRATATSAGPRGSRACTASPSSGW